MVTLSYPGTRKQDREFDDRQEAIAAAYAAADEHDVEVRDGDTLLVRYPRRDEPALPPDAVAERAPGEGAVTEPGPDGS